MVLRFADFELDTDQYELRRSGDSVPIERRVFDLLHYLVVNSPRVVQKAELFEQVWKGRHVADGSLSVAIAAARSALRDDARHPSIIRTCHGRGYQFALRYEEVEHPLCDSVGRSADRQYHRDPIIGRHRELAELSQAAARLRQQQSSLILLSGEPGIGKTRLLDEMLYISAQSHLRTFVGRCAESGDVPALWPWSLIFRSFLKSRPHDWRSRLSQRHVRSLSIIVPEVSPEDSDAFADHDTPDAARFQLYEGLLEALVELLDGEAAVIILDDLHRADEATLRFSRFAIRGLRHLPIAFVAAYRSNEIQPDSSHAQLLAALAREPHAIALHIEGLNAADSAQLFQGLCPGRSRPTDVDRIYSKTGGNPFFTRQLATLLASNPAKVDLSSEVSLPKTLRLAILEQTNGLSPGARQLLTTAAVLGSGFPFHTLAAVGRSETHDFDAALAELISSTLIRRTAEEADQLRFTHVLVRDALYEQIPSAERRVLHEETARSLTSLPGTLSGENAGEIAYHLFEAGTYSSLIEARLLSETAAQASSRRSAHDDAGRQYRRALDALQLTDSDNTHERCRLLLALGAEQCRAGNRFAAKGTFSQAASVARELNEDEVLAHAALGVAPGFLAAEAGGSDAFLEELLEESLTVVGSSNPTLRARIAARLAMALHWSSAPQRMHEVIRIARDVSEQVEDPETRLHVLVARWFCEWHHEKFEERTVLAERIHAEAQTLRDREMILMGLMLRQVGRLERGEIALFDASLSVFAHLASVLQQPSSLWYTPLYRSMRALHDGDTARAATLQTELAAVAERIEDANAFHSLAAQSSILSWEMGTLAASLPGLVDGSRRYPTIPGFRAAVAWAHAKTGIPSRATREFDLLASADFADFSERFDWPTAVALSAEVACDLGDAPRAAILRGMLEPLANQFLVIGLGVASFGSAARLLGRLSETMGRGEEAEAYYRMAIERNAAAGAHAWTAHSKLDYAVFLARTGPESKRDYRVGLASEVFETASDLGLLSLRERADSFLENATERRGARRAP